jgi:hypothetical protein
MCHLLGTRLRLRECFVLKPELAKCNTSYYLNGRESYHAHHRTCMVQRQGVSGTLRSRERLCGMSQRVSGWSICILIPPRRQDVLHARQSKGTCGVAMTSRRRMTSRSTLIAMCHLWRSICLRSNEEYRASRKRFWPAF